MVDNKAPRWVIVVNVDEVYFQCARADVRSELPARHVEAKTLPLPGEILATMSDSHIGGERYDAE